MKTAKQIREKIKETKSKVFNPENQEPMLYWLGFLRALEWVSRNDKNKTNG